MKESISKYFKENRRWLGAGLIVFSLGLILGFISSVVFPNLLSIMVSYLQTALEKEIAVLEQQNNIQAFLLIWWRNVKATLSLSFGGIIFGLLPAFGLLLNGFILGIICGSMIFSGNILIVLATVVPHGLIEIPALILAGSWGFKIGINWLRGENNQKRGKVLVQDLKSLVLFYPVIILLLMVASLIEVYISGYLARLF